MSKSKHISSKKRAAIKANELAFNQAMILALKKSKTRFKKFENLIEDASLQRLESNHCDERIQVLKSCFLSSKKVKVQNRNKAFKALMIYLTRSNTKIIKHADLIKAIYNVCKHKDAWIKGYETWKPRSNNAYNQFYELVTWLYCKYPVPKFLYNTWTNRQEMKYVDWFIYLGSGKSVKMLPRMPILLTKKMAHLFSKGPNTFSVPEVIRWAQVLGLGGDEVLARRVAASTLSFNNFSNEIFWSKFIQILVNAGMFNYDKITEIIDYLNNRLREEPSYSLKGRNFNSLLRQSNAWHAIVNNTNYTKLMAWKPSGLSAFTLKEGKDNWQVEFMIIELLHSKALLDEGRAMRHCVASYVGNCVKNRSAIFSIRKYKLGFEMERLATVEVNLSANRIVQAKYKYNKPISSKTKNMLATWAYKNSLTIGPYL